ncbi:hypothetical protein HK102_010364, partial [Quaeritorhiza haematococci]
MALTALQAPGAPHLALGDSVSMTGLNASSVGDVHSHSVEYGGGAGMRKQVGGEGTGDKAVKSGTDGMGGADQTMKSVLMNGQALDAAAGGGVGGEDPRLLSSSTTDPKSRSARSRSSSHAGSRAASRLGVDSADGGQSRTSRRSTLKGGGSGRKVEQIPPINIGQSDFLGAGIDGITPGVDAPPTLNEINDVHSPKKQSTQAHIHHTPGHPQQQQQHQQHHGQGSVGGSGDAGGGEGDKNYHYQPATPVELLMEYQYETLTSLVAHPCLPRFVSAGYS